MSGSREASNATTRQRGTSRRFSGGEGRAEQMVREAAGSERSDESAPLCSESVNKANRIRAVKMQLYRSGNTVIAFGINLHPKYAVSDVYFINFVSIRNAAMLACYIQANVRNDERQS